MTPEIIDRSIPLTVRDLWEFARKNNLEDARLRICDGMAVSYFPRIADICVSPDRVIIDVSDLDPVEYDELSAVDKRIRYPFLPL